MDDTGKTIGEYLTAQEKLLSHSSESLRNAYTEYIQTQAQEGILIYTHYRILDINGDGADDLLLSGDGEKFWSYQTCRYGAVRYPDFPSFYLCEGGVLENVSQTMLESGGKVDIHQFYRITEDLQVEKIAYAAHNRSTDAWMSDEEGTLISPAEAEANLAKYPRIDQGMRPISELLG